MDLELTPVARNLMQCSSQSETWRNRVFIVSRQFLYSESDKIYFLVETIIQYNIIINRVTCSQSG